MSRSYLVIKVKNAKQSSLLRAFFISMILLVTLARLFSSNFSRMENALQPRSESFRFYRFYSWTVIFPGKIELDFLRSVRWLWCMELRIRDKTRIFSTDSIERRNDAMQSSTLTKSIRNGTEVFRNSRKRRKKKEKKNYSFFLERKETEKFFSFSLEFNRGFRGEQFWWLWNFQFIPFAEFLRRAVRDKRIRDTHSWIEMEVGLAL